MSKIEALGGLVQALQANLLTHEGLTTFREFLRDCARDASSLSPEQQQARHQELFYARVRSSPADHEQGYSNGLRTL